MTYDLDFEYDNHNFVAGINLSLENESFDHAFGSKERYVINWKFKNLTIVRKNKSRKINVNEMNNRIWSQLFNAIGSSFEHEYSKIEKYYLQ